MHECLQADFSREKSKSENCFYGEEKVSNFSMEKKKSEIFM
jgi:hypothetical protein